MDWVMERTQAALEAPMLHITDVRDPRSTSGPHDYYPNGDYQWPSPDTLDGLPYIQRNGQTNPDNLNRHRIIICQIRTNVAFLTSTYVLTGGEQYAARAVRYSREFFLDGNVYMVPHLSYAQAILGICPGRGIGIIDTLHLVDVVFTIEHLRKSPSMEPEVYEGLKKWFARYLGWMLTDANDIQEMNRDSNHGVCSFVQATTFAWLADSERITDFCREYYKKSFLKQRAEDGSFPRKLGKTEPYNYSLFIVDNIVSMCHPLSLPGDNLWEYEPPNRKSVKKTLDSITPYVLDEKYWPYPPGVIHFDTSPARYGFMILTDCALGRRGLLDPYDRLPAESTDEEARKNIAPRQPMLWV